MPETEKAMSAVVSGDFLFPIGGVKFEILSVRIVQEAGQKKHVVCAPNNLHYCSNIENQHSCML